MFSGNLLQMTSYVPAMSPLLHAIYGLYLQNILFFKCSFQFFVMLVFKNLTAYDVMIKMTSFSPESNYNVKMMGSSIFLLIFEKKLFS